MSTPIQIKPIGQIHASEETGTFQLIIDPPFRAGLAQLDQFSHVIVFWWAHQMDTPQQRATLTTALPYAPGVEAGVFACRAEYRPNPIAITTMFMLDVDVENGIVVLPWIDAFDGSPIIDLKPYIPISDRIRDFGVAPWFANWPAWMEDAAEFFAEHTPDLG